MIEREAFERPLAARLDDDAQAAAERAFARLLFERAGKVEVATRTQRAQIALYLHDFGMPREDTLIWFGILAVVVVEVGLITPPVGSVLFVASAVSKQKIEHVVRAMLPFYGMLLVVLGMVTYIPAISLWLPRMLGMQ